MRWQPCPRCKGQMLLSADRKQWNCLQCGNTHDGTPSPMPAAAKGMAGQIQARAKRWPEVPQRLSQIAGLLEAGKGIREIAAELGTSVNTVISQVRTLFIKLGIPRDRRPVVETYRDYLRVLGRNQEAV